MKKEGLIIMSEKYGINLEQYWMIDDSIEDVDDKGLAWNNKLDVCQIIDNYHDIKYLEDHRGLDMSQDLKRLTNMLAFPIGIRIHKLASKRDVLDYIEKRWDIIESQLESYRKKMRIKERKNQEINNFIYEYWEGYQTNKKNIKELKKYLDEYFSDNKLIYDEIYKIHNLEKKRRYSDISLVDDEYFKEEN